MVHRYNPDIHHRRSVRLKGYDYAATEAYFITICAHERESLFGEIVAGEMFPGEYGRVVLTEWLKTGDIRQEVLLGEFVVMPNHFHGILKVNDGATCHTGTARDGEGTVRMVGHGTPCPYGGTIRKTNCWFIAHHYPFLQILRNEMHQRNPQFSRLARMAT